MSALLGLYWVGSSGTHDCSLKQGKEISQVGVALGNQLNELNKIVGNKLAAEKNTAALLFVARGDIAMEIEKLQCVVKGVEPGSAR